MDVALALVSIAALALAGSVAVGLVRNAPRRELPLWWGVFVLLILVGAQRLVSAVRLIQDQSLRPSIEFSIALAAGPIATAVGMLTLRPIIKTYRLAEQRRQASDEAFERSLATSRDPLAIIDGVGRYIYVNDAGCGFFGYERDQILGHHFREFITGIDLAPHGTVERAAETGAAQVEREVLRGDGSRIEVECDLIALGDGRILIVGRDLTPRREAEATRARAERLAATRTLSTIIGADFADTLAFAKSSLDLTAEFGSERVPVDAPIAAITRALELMTEFTALSAQASGGSEEPPPPAIDIRPLLREAVDQAALLRQDRTVLQLSNASTPMMVNAAPADVARVCSGLLANACAAVDESLNTKPAGGFAGRIAILVRDVDPGDPTAPREIEIIVDDNGGALSADVRAHLFEPLFHDLSRRLGLGATHALVLRLGGSMTVQRRPDGGSTVAVRLPRSREARD